MKTMIRFVSLLIIHFILFLPLTQVHAAVSCQSFFTSKIDSIPNSTILEWDGQIKIQNDRSDFKDLEGYSYSYTTKADSVKYAELAQKIFSNLNSGEKQAIDTYTQMSGNDYSYLNSAMDADSKVFKPKVKPKLISNLLSAFSKGVLLPKGLLLFRGLNANIQFGKIGSSVIWNRFTSTSMNPETARYFMELNSDSEKKYIMTLEIGEPVRALLSNDPTEMEFLLPPNLRYMIVSKKTDKAAGITVVHIKVFAK